VALKPQLYLQRTHGKGPGLPSLATVGPVEVKRKCVFRSHCGKLEDVPLLSYATVANFEARVRRSCPMEPRLRDPQSYRIIARSKLDSLFENNAGGREAIPSPGYNAARNEAVLYVGHSCGGLCGTGHLYSLTKQHDQRIVKN
jgi:hypothetical protein